MMKDDAHVTRLTVISFSTRSPLLGLADTSCFTPRVSEPCLHNSGLTVLFDNRECDKRHTVDDIHAWQCPDGQAGTHARGKQGLQTKATIPIPIQQHQATTGRLLSNISRDHRQDSSD